MECILEINNLGKTYTSTKKRALDNLSLKLYQGEVLGLVGANGAGKSTLIKCIAKLIKHNEGTIELSEKLNNDINAVGYMPEEINLYDYLSGNDFLELIGKLRNLSNNKIRNKIEELREVLELPDLNMLISSYSKGNKEKIMFLASIMHEPKIIILDEPFTGLDPIVIEKTKKYIMDYAQRGNTVVFSTHILEMVLQICNRIAVISSGSIKGIHDIDEFKNNAGDYNKLIDIYAKEIKGEET
jgi:ABC-2 type transport system ATP-binding protein